MKRFIILIIAVFLMFGLTSCNQTESSSDIGSLSSNSSVSQYLSYEAFTKLDDGDYANLIVTVTSRTKFIATDNVNTRYLATGNIKTILGDVGGHSIELNTLQIDEIEDAYIHTGAIIYIRGEKQVFYDEPYIATGRIIDIPDAIRNWNEQEIDDSVLPSTITVEKGSDLSTDKIIYSGVNGDVTITRDGYYQKKFEVALYIFVFHHLPHNYHTDGDKYFQKTSLDMIGGNCFNENPKPSNKVTPGTTFTECDVDNYGYDRGITRIVFSRDMQYIYYTADHYDTYVLLSFDK